MPQALERIAPKTAPWLSGPPRAEVAASIRAVTRQEWNACFPHDLENWDYLLAVEEAGIEGFEWRYVVVREAGRVVAAMPGFICRYGLETTLDNPRFREAFVSIRRFLPRFLTLRLACLGSPCTEIGNAGFNPDVPAVRQKELFHVLLAAFESHAADQKCPLVALKDIPMSAEGLAGVLLAKGFVELSSMPTASMDVNFDTSAAYLAGLSPATRKDLRRKLRVRNDVRIEYRTDFGGFLPRVMELYRATRERSEWQFENLTPAYFEGVLRQMPGRAVCVLYFVGDDLLAANLLLWDEETLIDKFFCMDGTRGRDYNLYYLSWFTNIEFCLEKRIARYQSGQAYYRNKVRLGSQLSNNSMFFRHRNPVLQWILKAVSPVFAIKEEEKSSP